MAISQKHRSTIYQTLSPIIGEEEAEALLSQFPSRDLDEPVTKEFVRAEIEGLRGEMHGALRTQTIWIASAMAVGMGIAAGLGRL
jgi:hypothetical protein